jgi:hypothetical protein
VSASILRALDSKKSNFFGYLSFVALDKRKEPAALVAEAAGLILMLIC